MIYLDANVILRYILCDNEEQAKVARDLIQSENCVANNEVIAEVVYVLDKVYEIDRGEIKKALFGCLKKILVKDKTVMQNAIDLYSKRHFDFVDCLLASQAVVAGDSVFSFDKKLNSYINNFSSNNPI